MPNTDQQELTDSQKLNLLLGTFDSQALRTVAYSFKHCVHDGEYEDMQILLNMACVLDYVTSAPVGELLHQKTDGLCPVCFEPAILMKHKLGIYLRCTSPECKSSTGPWGAPLAAQRAWEEKQ